MTNRKEEGLCKLACKEVLFFLIVSCAAALFIYRRIWRQHTSDELGICVSRPQVRPMSDSETLYAFGCFTEQAKSVTMIKQS